MPGFRSRSWQLAGRHLGVLHERKAVWRRSRKLSFIPKLGPAKDPGGPTPRPWKQFWAQERKSPHPRPGLPGLLGLRAVQTGTDPSHLIFRDLLFVYRTPCRLYFSSPSSSCRYLRFMTTWQQ